MYAEQHKGESIIMGWFYNNVDKIYTARWNFWATFSMERKSGMIVESIFSPTGPEIAEKS